MILLDANLLLYAHNAGSAQFGAAKKWLEAVISEPEPVGLPWVSALAFLRISTNPRAFPDPYSIAEAVVILSDYFAVPSVVAIHPGSGHWELLSSLLEKSQARGDLVSDAHLAALAIENGATLCTTDRGFARFPGLRFLNPLD